MSLEDADHTTASRPEQKEDAYIDGDRRRGDQSEKLTFFESRNPVACQGGVSSYFDFIHDLPTAALLLNLEEDIVHQVNDRFLALTGYAREEIVGQDIGQLGIESAIRDGVGFKRLIEDNPYYHNVGLQLSESNGKIQHVMSSARIISESADSYLLASFMELRAQRYLQRVGMEVLARKQRQVGENLQEELTQTLTGLRLLGRALAVASEDDPEGPDTMVGNFNVYLDKAAKLTRELREELLPVEVDEEGLAAALKRLAYDVEVRYGVLCRFRSGESVRIPDHTAATICYYLAEQTVQRMARMDHPGAVEIILNARHKDVELEVISRNVMSGVDERAGMRRALRLMRYAMGLLGGAVKIDDESDDVLRVVARLPV